MLLPAAARAQTPLLWAGLVRGHHGVGYQAVGQAAGTVHLWYPAASPAGRVMTVKRYAGAADSALATFLRRVGLPDSTAATLLDSPLLAREGAQPGGEGYPLVLLAQGNGHDAPDQAVLAEFLASHGFVVAATPSPMIAQPFEREDQVPAFAERQAGDLAAAIGVAARAVGADTTRLALVAHSFGARSALLLAMRRPGFRALVSLDGGIGTATADSLFRRSPSFRLDAPLPPVLHVNEELDAFMRPDLSLLRSLRTPRLDIVTLTAMRHIHFTLYGFAAAVLPDLAGLTRALPATGADVQSVAHRTLAFLEEFVR